MDGNGRGRVELPAKTVAVIICCFNSAIRLPETLAHVLDQDIEDLHVIVVDNGSNDRTAEVAREIYDSRNRNNFKLTVVSEPTSGLANARRAGVRASSEDLLIFCDDDNWLSSSYASCARIYMSAHPEAGGVGGAVTPEFEEGPPPYWFYSHGVNFAVGAQSLEDGDVGARGFLWGAGVVFRGHLLRALYACGVQHLCLGRNGSNLMSGDDAELSKWVLLSGWTLHASAELALKHYMPAERLTLSRLRQTLTQGDASTPFLLAYDSLLARRALLRSFSVRSMRLLAWSVIPLNWKYVRAASAARRRISRINWGIR